MSPSRSAKTGKISNFYGPNLIKMSPVWLQQSMVLAYPHSILLSKTWA